MTAPGSLKHLPNHACYGRKIHEGYMRKNTWLFVLIRQGDEQGEKTRGKSTVNRRVTAKVINAGTELPHVLTHAC